MSFGRCHVKEITRADPIHMDKVRHEGTPDTSHALANLHQNVYIRVAFWVPKGKPVYLNTFVVFIRRLIGSDIPGNYDDVMAIFPQGRY
jgi:hypothetical protein